MTTARLSSTNPFAEPSTLPYELADFAAIRDEHYRPAFAAGMAEERAEVDAIVSQGSPATEENTLAALERSGRLLSRVSAVFFNQISAAGTNELERIEQEIVPQLAAHHDAIYMDPRLAARLQELHRAAESGTVDLGDASKRLLAGLLRDVRRAGVELAEADRDRLRDLNAQIVTAEAAFGRRLLAGTHAAAVWFARPGELAGLAPDVLAGAAAAAGARGNEDGYLIELQSPTRQGVMAALRDRGARARIQRASESRGANGDQFDTRELVVELARLRAERAQLLGYDHHAAYVVQEATARTTEAVSEMLSALAPAAAANARREAAELEQVMGSQCPGATLAAHDWAYWSQRVRADRFSIDEEAMRPYFDLERVVHDGVFRAAHLLYGLSFAERDDLRGYHSQVRVFEVFDGEVGAPNSGLGLFLADWFTRPEKQGGAWMNNLIDQNGLLGQRPVVVNNLNIVPPASGQPALLTWDEVTTVFHEFGHALHGLLSEVYYPSQSGTEVPADFVEYPSQVNEMWAWHPHILGAFAVHYETGEPMPAQWVSRLAQSRDWGQGFATAEHLAAAILDQAWHVLSPEQVPQAEEVLAFEASVLAAAGLDIPGVPPRYRSTYFNHIFAGGYAAGYYSYLWSEVLDADTVDWFTHHGGLTRSNGERFRRVVLAKGDSVDPLTTYESFRGRPASTTALLVRRGLHG